MSDNRNTLGVIGLGAVAAAAVGVVALGRTLSSNRTEGRSDDAPGRTARRDFGDYDVVGRTVTIGRPRAELFAMWRDFARLAEFMENLERVESLPGDKRYRFTIKAPAGQTVDVETEVVREEQDRLIAWRSIEGSDIDTEGRVTFEDAPGERGTRVTLIVAWQPPAGALGKGIAKLFLRDPETQARHDLKRFKMLMETGEIATSARLKSQTRAAQQENR